MSNIELVWDALDEIMVELNQRIPPRAFGDVSKIEHSKMDREKQKGEALGLARALALLTDRGLEDVRQEAIARYVSK